MKVYTGIDIVFIPRFKRIVEKYGKVDFSNRFIERIFNQEELEHILGRSNPYNGLAGRFAAKEATIKAFSGIIKLLSYKKIKVVGAVPELVQPSFSNVQTSVSISHDEDYAIASVSLLVDGEILV